eukprot:TRINITY_DN308_c0_g2_i12.p1 TRINITY_DN308_c0_g2~~TRINITY_DN308_c0_g2_i12.p1  ORF type:complete len:860 (-),score=106.31 TRINITY_DN308_c0_g2_i12:41-2620(-)
MERRLWVQVNDQKDRVAIASGSLVVDLRSAIYESKAFSIGKGTIKSIQLDNQILQVEDPVPERDGTYKVNLTDEVKEKVIQVLYHNQARKISVRKDTNLVQTLINVFALDETSKLVLFKSDISIDINFGTVEDKQIYNLQVTPPSITPGIFVFTLPAPKTNLDQFVAIFQDPSFAKIIYDLSGLVPPKIPAQIYQQFSVFLKPLPVSVNDDTKLDLRLIDGHLGNPKQMSPSLQNLLAKFNDTAQFCNPKLILSGSGVGKSKLLFDVLKLKYGVILDCSAGLRGKDFDEMFANINNRVANKIRDPNFELKCSLEILLSFAARVIALILYRLSFSITPTQWLLCQLNGLTFGTDYFSFLGRIRFYLRQSCSVEYSPIFFNYLFENARKFFGSRLIFEVDEANVLLKMHIDTFASARDSNHHSCRPLFTCLISSLSTLSDVIVIAAGTRLDLHDSDYWESLIAKIQNAPRTLEIISDLPMMTLSLFREFTSNLFAPAHQKTARSLWSFSIPPPARFRYLTTWVDSFVPHHDSLEKSMEEFKRALTQSNEIWSLSKMIRNFVAHHSNGKELLGMFVTSYLVYDGVIRDTKTVSWMSDGFCRCTPKEGEYFYFIDEPLVIYCIIDYFHKENIPIASYIVDQVLKADSPSAAGLYMDRVIACSLFDRTSIPLQLHTTQNSIETLHTKLDIIMFTSLDNSSEHGSLFSNLCLKGNYILPKHYAGPDGIVLTFDNVLWIIGCKTTTREHRKVDTRSVNHNFDTTDLANLFGQSKGQFLQEKNEIWQYLSELPLRYIIRVHIVLPGAAEKATFSPGFTVHRTKQTYNNITISAIEYLLDVDSNFLPQCGLFSSSIAQTLLTKYKQNI